MEVDSKMSTIGRDGSAKQLSSSVQRALAVLEAVIQAPSDIGILELAEQLDLPQSSVHRFLANLEARGLIEKHPMSSRYSVGLRLLTLSGVVSRKQGDGTGLPPATHAIFQRAVERAGETGYIAVLDRFEVVYVDSVEGGDFIRATAPVGARRPVYCTAVGKVLVSELDQLSRDRILDSTPMESRTPRTITDREQLERSLITIREQGCAIDIEEFAEGLTCLAAPIRDHLGFVIAALGITGPASRMTGERLDYAVRTLIHAAAEISAAASSRDVDAAL